MSEQDIDPVKTGRLIYKLRKKRQMTQQELGDAVYVTRKAVSKWETGNGCPSIDTLKRLANFFEISLEELIAGDCLVTRIAAQRRFILKVIKNKWFKIIGGSILALVLLLIIILLLFFRSNDRIYLLNYEDDTITMINTIINLSDESEIIIRNLYSNISNTDGETEYKFKLYYEDREGNIINIAVFGNERIIKLDKGISDFLKKELSHKSWGTFFLNVTFTDNKMSAQEYDLRLELTEGSKEDLVDDKESISIQSERAEEDIIDVRFLFEMSDEKLKQCFANKKVTIDKVKYNINYNSSSLSFQTSSLEEKLIFAIKDKRIIISINTSKAISLSSSWRVKSYALEKNESDFLKEVVGNLKKLCSC